MKEVFRRQGQIISTDKLERMIMQAKAQIRETSEEQGGDSHELKMAEKDLSASPERR